MKALKDGRLPMRNTLRYGKIVCKIPEIALAKGFGLTGAWKGKVNIKRLSRQSGITGNVLYYLLRHPETFQRIDVHTLAKLCFALECQPGDLFKYEYSPSEGSLVLGGRDDELDDLPGVE